MLYIVLFGPSRWMSTYDRLRIREIQFFIRYYEWISTYECRRSSTVDRRSRTDDRRRSTVDGRRLSTDDRRPTTVDRRPSTDDWWSSTYDGRRSSSDDSRRSTIVDRRPTTDNWLSSTDDISVLLPITSSQMERMRTLLRKQMKIVLKILVAKNK